MDGEEEIIVHADEVDETGADVSVLSASTDAELTSQVEERNQEVRDIGIAPPPLSSDENPRSPVRSSPRLLLERNNSVPPPPPPKQPPPLAPEREVGGAGNGADGLASPGGNGDNGRPTDSLSLAQLKNIVSNFQRMEPTAYAYTYADTRSFAEEIEEWFQYTVEDRALLRRIHAAFDAYVSEHRDVGGKTHSWSTWVAKDQKEFVKHLLPELEDTDPEVSIHALDVLGYVALGGWFGTFADSQKAQKSEEADFEPPNDRFKKSVGQIHSIRNTAKLLCECGALGPVWRAFLSTCHQDESAAANDSKESSDSLEASKRVPRRRDLTLTILYIMIESGRWYSSQSKDLDIKDAFAKLEPNFLGTLCHQIARVRWDEDYDLQVTRAVQLLWKGMLLILGSTDDLAESKKVLSGPGGVPPPKGKPQSLLTTTPLDYHMFRQEIISKYPAYNPPPPLLPLEPENTSLLPPLPRHSRAASQSSMNVQPAKFNKSIFEQPVHIMTPVPSPPPSPAGPGGKGGKKQNYQTNQHFPFLYPPLDVNSNDLGGKGGVAMQDRLVTKKWKGSDVPASILEAGELFASRMRMSRPTRQLWEARESCIKYDRGWAGIFNQDHDGDEGALLEDIEELKLDDDSEDYDDILRSFAKKASSKPTPSSSTPSVDTQETDDPAVQQQLDLADAFYRGALPHLQSIIIVVLKILLANISATGGQPGSSQPSPAMPQFPLTQRIDESRLSRANVNLIKQLSSASNGVPLQEEGLEGSFEALNSARIREITSKAISGMLLTMLKWFRFSHVLKFQLMTQLLLDSNYLPLALKYFAMQDVDRGVDRKTDNDRLGFFQFCREDAGIEPTEPAGQPHDHEGDGDEEEEEIEEAPALSGSPGSSEDEAQPPPIRRRKSAPSPPRLMDEEESPVTGRMGPLPTAAAEPDDSPPTSPGGKEGRARKPEVDELGYPTTALPQQPLTTYSARFFFTTIALLRVLQKVTKGHAHRALLLVQYKSSTILRKALKVPQPALRLYTLKLFKSQVPFCGRKWRQANMRVITAIYVFCRMGLRDDWISGTGAVDDWVENAVATEQAWRGLAGWWHSRFYRDAVGLHPPGHAGAGRGEDGDENREDDGEDDDDDDDDDEDDFFMRELEKMGWMDGPSELEGADEDPEGGGGDWEGGLLQPEGW